MKQFPRYFLKLLPISFIGVVLGHIFVYRWIFPDSSHRHTELDATGHSYFPMAVALSTFLSIISIGVYIWLGYKEKSRGLHVKRPSFWQVVSVLFVVQSLLFVSMELLERLSTDGSSGVLLFLSSTLLPLGIVFQLITAMLVALVVCSAQAIGELLVTRSLVVTRSALKILRGDRRYIAKLIDTYLSIRGPPNSHITCSN